MKISKFIILHILFYALSGMSAITICGQSNSQPKMKVFNKRSQSCEQNKENFKKKLETNVSDIISGKKGHPKIIKYFVTTYQEDIKEVLLWINEQRNSEECCEYKDEKEALQELFNDTQRISKENELSSWHIQTTQQCMWENYGNQTVACKNLAHAYDSFRFHSQGIPETRTIKSLDHQINVNYDDKYTVAFLEKAKKRLQEDLKKTNLPLFNSLQKLGAQQVLDNNPSYLESLSEQDKQALITIIENVVCEKVTNFDNLAEEFQNILYVFHEQAARKHLSEQEAFKGLREDAERIYKQKNNYSPYIKTAHLCELEWSNNKTAECKHLAQAYKQLRSYSSMHEIKNIHSLQKQIDAKSGILASLSTNSHNEPVIAFLEEEKAKLEQDVKRVNNGHIPTKIPSYYESRSQEDKEKIDTIIKNVVRKKIDKVDEFSEEYQRMFDVFNEKL